MGRYGRSEGASEARLLSAAESQSASAAAVCRWRYAQAAATGSDMFRDTRVNTVASTRNTRPAHALSPIFSDTHHAPAAS